MCTGVGYVRDPIVGFRLIGGGGFFFLGVFGLIVEDLRY